MPPRNSRKRKTSKRKSPSNGRRTSNRKRTSKKGVASSPDSDFMGLGISKKTAKTALAGLGIAGATIGAGAVKLSRDAARKRQDKEERIKEEEKAYNLDRNVLIAEASGMIEKLKTDHESRDKFEKPTLVSKQLFDAVEHLIDMEKDAYERNVLKSQSNQVKNALNQLRNNVMNAKEKLAGKHRVKASKSILDEQNFSNLVRLGDTLDEETVGIIQDLEDNQVFKDRFRNKVVENNPQFKNQPPAIVEAEAREIRNDLLEVLVELQEQFSNVILEAKESLQNLQNLDSDARRLKILYPHLEDKIPQYNQEISMLLFKPVDLEIVGFRNPSGLNEIEKTIENAKRALNSLKQGITNVEEEIIPLREIRPGFFGNTFGGIFG